MKVARKQSKRNPPPPPVFGSLRKAVGAKRVEKIPRVRSVHDGKEGTVVRELQGGWLKIKLDDLNKHVLAAPGEYARTNPRTKKVIIIKIQNGILSKIGGVVKRPRARVNPPARKPNPLRLSDLGPISDRVRKQLEAQGAFRETGKSDKSVKTFKVTWYSPKARRRITFGYPVEAHTKSDAISEVKAALGYDSLKREKRFLPTNFVVTEVRSNPSDKVVRTGWFSRARKRRKATRAFARELRAQDRLTAARKRRSAAERDLQQNPKHKTTTPAVRYRQALSALRKTGKRSAFEKAKKAAHALGLSAARIVKDARSGLAKGRPKGTRRNPSNAYQVRINPLAPDAAHQIEVSHHFRGGGKSFRQRVIEAGQMDFWGESGNNRAINPKKKSKRKNPIPYMGDIIGGIAGGAGYVAATHALTKWLEKEKKNPIAQKPTRAIAKLHNEFQGRPSAGQSVLQTMPGTPTHLAQLGGLHEIRLVNGQVLKFNSQRVRLCADGRHRLHVAGLRYKVNGKANPRIQRNLGKVESVTYYTRKNHIGRGKPYLYVHGLGEEGGAKPNLLLVNGYLKFKGGSYYIKPEGIRD